MVKSWRLTRAAEAALSEIPTWTFETFGPRQAAAYEADLIARCEGIASGAAPSQDCRAIIAPNLAENLRFTRAGQHFVVFVEDAEQVIIVDFLHGRADLSRKLAALRNPGATGINDRRPIPVRSPALPNRRIGAARSGKLAVHAR